MYLQDDAYERERGPCLAYIARDVGLQVGLGREY
jgi:hypothetical protein